MLSAHLGTLVITPKRRIAGFMATLGTAIVLLAPISVSAQIALGTAANFGVLGGTTVTNTGPSVVTGNVGSFGGTAITGFPPGIFTGSFEDGTAGAGQAQTDLNIALTTAANAICNTILTGQDLGGLTLTPGVYCFATGAGLTGNLTLDFQGDPNANFLFKTGSTLTTASASAVRFINTNGATCLPNVNWRIGSSATFGTFSTFAGNILAQTSITLTTGANLRGRALARDAAVTLDSNAAVGGCPFAVAGAPGGGGGGGGGGGISEVPTLQEWSLIFLGLMLAAAGAWYARRRRPAVA